MESDRVNAPSALTATSARTLSHRARNVVFLAAGGARAEDIAEQTNLSLFRVQLILGSDRGLEEVKRLKWKMHGESSKAQFEALLPAAIDTVHEVMGSRRLPARTRLSAAQIIMDRALGKPKETVDVNHNNPLRQLYEELRQKRNAAIDMAKPIEKAIEVEVRSIQDQPQPTPPPEEPAPSSAHVEAWVAENL